VELSVEGLAELVEKRHRERPNLNANEVLDEVLEEQGFRFPDFGRMRRQVAELLFDRNIKKYLEDPSILKQVKLTKPKAFVSDEDKMFDSEAINYAIKKVEGT
jgi:hypothetical protein